MKLRRQSKNDGHIVAIRKILSRGFQIGYLVARNSALPTDGVARIFFHYEFFPTTCHGVIREKEENVSLVI